METYQTVREAYSKALEEVTQKIKRFDKGIARLSLLRVVDFLLIVASVACAVSYRHADFYWLAALALLCFVYVAWIQNRYIRNRNTARIYKSLYERELKGFDGDYSGFGNGGAYVDTSHPYTYDLDIFGNESLFQSLNRTATPAGESLLAAWFREHPLQKEEIESRQEAVKELSGDPGFCHDMYVAGHLHRGEQTDLRTLAEWAAQPARLGRHRAFRLLPWAVLLVNVVCITLGALGIVAGSMAALVFTFFLVAGLVFSKKVGKIEAEYGQRLRILRTYARQIALIERKRVSAPNLVALKNSLEGTSGSWASEALHRLDRMLHALEQRGNLLVGVILNGLMWWELNQAMRIEQWKREYGARLLPWLQAVGTMDAYCSLALFAYHHPDYVYPVISRQQGCLRGELLGHPLMNRRMCVKNPVEIESAPHFLIITGANMAGKSTYLRTVGVNYLLACIGVPVCASKFEICPARLFTSLRTTDSLQHGESYFFAELKRLQQIIGLLQEGKELFIILDEILKGTNSVDKRKGSLALVRQLIQLHATGIIATHDLELGTLVHNFPEYVDNLCFEADIENNRLTFSYRLRKGIAHNMNACFLMKKMGIAMPDEEALAGETGEK